jgi:hypothetical protein
LRGVADVPPYIDSVAWFRWCGDNYQLTGQFWETPRIFSQIGSSFATPMLSQQKLRDNSPLFNRISSVESLQSPTAPPETTVRDTTWIENDRRRPAILWSLPGSIPLQQIWFWGLRVRNWSIWNGGSD